MDHRRPTLGRDASSAAPTAPPPPPPPLRRRLSMEEDFHYQAELMTAAAPRRPSHPPPYDVEARPPRLRGEYGSSSLPSPVAKGKSVAAGGSYLDEQLPSYSCSVQCEGVFEKKMEIENTIKRAEDRNWHTAFVSLQGTALNVYNVKKDWGWGRSRDGPTISPDNPPWIRKSSLDKTYSLLYADVGIAADYRKRRYVIRVRAETDQFLLSCVELSTFIKWLECLFAAIDVASAIEDREFPRDQSIPRIQRIRWFRGQSPTRTELPFPAPQPPTTQRRGSGSGSTPTPMTTATLTPGTSASPNEGTSRRGSSSISPEPSGRRASAATEHPPRRGSTAGIAASLFRRGSPPPEPMHEVRVRLRPSTSPERSTSDDDASATLPRSRADPINRLSTSSYPNEGVDLCSGKWMPEHQWSSAHDLLYARLCFNYLFFKSPRKSNYIIQKGKKWFVDWTTGRMVRVLPPAYGEVELFGPWQVIHTENRRI